MPPTQANGSYPWIKHQVLDVAAEDVVGPMILDLSVQLRSLQVITNVGLVYRWMDGINNQQQ